MFLLAGTAWGRGPQPGVNPLAPGNRLHISAADRCPVCAMRPIQYPRFASAIQIQDKTTFYFCSAGCMLKAWLRPDVFLKTPLENLKTPVAQDYFSGQPVDARTVLWISGSDVIGPMGPALVPLQQSTHVDAFRRRHGLTHIFRLEELNADTWETLTGKPFHF
jgi:nitrous oxide reductase accessory protein NosL